MAVHQKLTQHCRSTILQKKKKDLKNSWRNKDLYILEKTKAKTYKKSKPEDSETTPLKYWGKKLSAQKFIPIKIFFINEGEPVNQ